MYEAAITPAFSDFLPPWVARQPWFTGSQAPRLRNLGSYRFQDPAGEVGIETHLVTDGIVVYQLPLTYRGAPLPGGAGALIATAVHSRLGDRWIYDAEADPVWRAELLRMVATQGASDAASSHRAQARGLLLADSDLRDADIELVRVLGRSAGALPGAAGVVLGSWIALDGSAAEGCLAIVVSRIGPE
ncbi:MAG TPA: hypothetical protein VKU39_22280 [Streptosporangiaceae bacterium]|nr:hypothetical protein [Streptosporangiaceae bacterium]